MKKIFLTLLTLLTLCFVASYGFCSTVNSYDSYGRKTGSYRTSGSILQHLMISMDVKQE
ncbi:unknown [Clostridium sp. CAG:715]|nr:unknown [Clostridium sp. CAG:715]